MSTVKVNTLILPEIAKNNLKTPAPLVLGLVGAVGTGTTQWLRFEYTKIIADHYGIDVADLGYVNVRLSGRDGDTVMGFAIPAKGDDGMVTVSTKPEIIDRIERTGREFGLLLLDELLQADTHAQKALSDLFDPEERTLNGFPIPDGWVIAFTGNRTSDKSGANKLLSHLVNRCAIFEMDFDLGQWVRWANDNGVNPLITGCAEAMDGFFEFEVPMGAGNFCTPRSAVRASDQLNAFLEDSEHTDIDLPEWLHQLLGSIIGERAGRQLREYILLSKNVPHPAEIISAPLDADVPNNTGFQLLAANRAIAAAITSSDLESVLRYVIRLRPDLQVSLGSKILRHGARRGLILASPEAAQFVAKFHQLIPLAEAAGMEV